MSGFGPLPSGVALSAPGGLIRTRRLFDVLLVLDPWHRFVAVPALDGGNRVRVGGGVGVSILTGPYDLAL